MQVRGDAMADDSLKEMVLEEDISRVVSALDVIEIKMKSGEVHAFYRETNNIIIVLRQQSR